MKKLFDMWAVQDSVEDLYIALDKIKTDDIIIFDNAIVQIKIGDEYIKDRVFNCAIFSEESDKLVLIMKHGNVTTQDAIDYFDKNGIKYSLVTFLEAISSKKEITTPKIWLARDPHVISAACDNLIKKGATNLTYKFDKNQTSMLKFNYLDSNIHDLTSFDSQIFFKGMITMEDTIILIVDTPERFLEKKFKEIEKILANKGFVETNTLSI